MDLEFRSGSSASPRLVTLSLAFDVVTPPVLDVNADLTAPSHHLSPALSALMMEAVPRLTTVSGTASSSQVSVKAVIQADLMALFTRHLVCAVNQFYSEGNEYLPVCCIQLFSISSNGRKTDGFMLQRLEDLSCRTPLSVAT